MAHHVNIDGSYSKAQRYCLEHPEAIAHANVKGVKVQYTFSKILHRMFYRPSSKFHLPEEQGWASCKMQ